MNIAVVIAAGKGNRTGQDIPKQFLNVYDKPIIIYTLNAFQNHPLIDAIEIVCLDGWQDMLLAYCKQFGIAKLKWIVKGGDTGQESLRNGIYNLENEIKKDDIVIIHDGIRPMVSEDVITDCIEKCKIYGSGVTVLPVTEQIFSVGDSEKSSDYIPRENLRIMQTPQAYKYEKVFNGYKKAFAENIGITGSAYTNTMLADLGEELYFALGSSKNIKITTKNDIEIFKAMLAADESAWLK